MRRILVLDDTVDGKFSPLFDETIMSENFSGLMEKNTHYFMIGSKSWGKVLTSGMHIGLRGDSTVDKVSNLRFLNIGNGCVLTLMKSSLDIYEEVAKKKKAKKEFFNEKELLSSVRGTQFPKLKEKLTDFLKSPDYGVPKVGGLGENITYVTKNSDIEDSFKRLENWTESEFGLDYETSGLTHEKDFAVIGVGISTNKFAIYFDWRELELSSFLTRYKEFLDKFGDKCWVRNVDFEQEATYRYLGKFYNFRELAALRVIEGIPSMNAGSLKYITRDELGVPSWDDEYDDLLDNTSDENWRAYVSKRYPNHVSQFDYFHNRGYNTAFTRIPTDIIGRYCCYDSYYTLMCYEINREKYTPLCWDVYTNNYLARNRMTGIFVNEEELETQSNQATTLFLMGTYYCVREYFKLRIKELGELPDEVKKDYFLLNNITYDEKPSDLAKKMLSLVRDENVPKFIDVDKWEKYFGDEGLLRELYNLLPDDWQINLLGRQRKVCARLQEWLTNRQKFYDLASLSELIDVHSNYYRLMDNDFDNENIDFLLKAKTVVVDGIEMGKVEATKYIQKEIFKITSAEVFSEFESYMISHLGKKNKIRKALTYLELGYDKLKSITGLDNYRDNYGEFNRNKDCKKSLDNDPSLDGIRISLRDDKWFNSNFPIGVRKYVADDNIFYSLLNDLRAPKDEVIAFYKFKVFRDMFKKYGKILSTYLTSIMYKYNRLDHKADRNLHSIRWFEGEDKTDTVVRSYPKFLLNSTMTKRWSSGY